MELKVKTLRLTFAYSIYVKICSSTTTCNTCAGPTSKMIPNRLPLYLNQSIRPLLFRKPQPVTITLARNICSQQQPPAHRQYHQNKQTNRFPVQCKKMSTIPIPPDPTPEQATALFSALEAKFPTSLADDAWYTVAVSPSPNRTSAQPQTAHPLHHPYHLMD